MSIHHHIHAFDKTIAHLLDLDENVKDENKALLLLNFLLDEYLAITLLYDKDKATFDVVCTTLLCLLYNSPKWSCFLSRGNNGDSKNRF